MKIKTLAASIILLNAGFTLLPAMAYEGALLDNPVELGAQVQPNILLLLDDSSSMRESVLINSDAIDAYRHSAQTGNVNDNLSVINTNPGNLDFTPDSDTDLLALCSAINIFAFDPKKSYEPWASVDDAGQPFTDQTLATARDNPYLASGGITDLSDHFYLEPTVGSNYTVIDPDSAVASVDRSENGIDGICGPLLRAYEEIPTYLIGYNADSNATQGVLYDSGGPTLAAGENGDGNYSLFSRFDNVEFTINNSSSTSTVLTFPEGISLASESNNPAFDEIDQVRIYSGSKSDPNPIVFPDLSTASVGPDSNPDPTVNYNIYTNNPSSITINSSNVIVEFVRAENSAGNAPGFVIGWNIGTSAYPDRIVSKDECKSISNCVVVDDLDNADKVNYANWYSYSRNKDLVVKSALNDILKGDDKVNDADDLIARLGLAALNNKVGERLDRNFNLIPTPNGSGIGRIIENIDNTASRDALLQQIFSSIPLGETPLRRGLLQAGEYFTVGNGEDSVRDLFGPDVAAHPTTDVNNLTLNDTISTDSPILTKENGGYCQSNYTIAFTDGLWDDGDINGLTPIGDVDSTNPDATWANDSSFSDLSATADQLADVALYYFQKDLLAGANNDEGYSTDPTHTTIQNANGIDSTAIEVEHQHMRTTTISFGVSGSVDLGDDSLYSTVNYEKFKGGWGDNKIDDLAHAAWNGRGDYFAASDPESLKTSFEEAINGALVTRVSSSVGTLASSALESGSFSYRSFYDVSGNHGEVQAYAYDEVNQVFTNSDAFIGTWSADSQLTNDTSREIITMDSSGKGIAFTGDNFAKLSSVQQSNLIASQTTPAGDVDQDYGIAVLDYLRGSKAEERGESGATRNFRSRIGPDGDRHLLGPIINSSVLYVSDALADYPDNIESDTALYSGYDKTSYKDRPLVFVGANDGMLHAFDATSGEEVFAYIPSPKILENNLHDITDEAYESQAYVDGNLISADAYDGSAWRTMLVGALRTGGRGIYALDISNRDAFGGGDEDSSKSAEANAESIVAWEFTHEKLGYTFGQPQIVKINKPIASGGSTWAVVFGSGYGVGANCVTTDCGAAFLFIVDLFDPTKYQIIETDNTIGSVNFASTLTDKCSQNEVLDATGNVVVAASNCNGLSSPAVVDLDGNFTVDRIYAGDLHSNLWSFDVTTDTSSTLDATTHHLFDAGEGQSITARPAVIPHPTRLSSGNGPNLLVFFGTGQFLDNNDHIGTGQFSNNNVGDANTSLFQSFYAVWDNGDTNTKTPNNLVEQKIMNGQDGNTVFRTIDSAAVDYTNDAGWHMKLIGDDGLSGGDNYGERVVSRAIPLRDIVYFITSNPDDAFCVGGGSSYLMGVNSVDGNNANFDVLDRFTGTSENEAGVRFSELITGLIPAEDSEGNVRLVTPGSDVSNATEDPTEGVNSSGFNKPAGRRAWSIIR